MKIVFHFSYFTVLLALAGCGDNNPQQSNSPGNLATSPTSNPSSHSIVENAQSGFKSSQSNGGAPSTATQSQPQPMQEIAADTSATDDDSSSNIDTCTGVCADAHPPVANAGIVVSTAFEEPLSLSKQLNATDPDGGTVTYSVNSSDIDDATISDTGLSRFTIPTHSNLTEEISYEISYRITDQASKFVDATIPINITPEDSREFEVTELIDSSTTPVMATLGDSGFIVVWQDTESQSGPYNIYAQRYNQAGVKIGNELTINTTATGNQTAPAIAPLSDSKFVVVWQSNGGGQTGASGDDIYGKIYTIDDDNELQSGNEFRVNIATAGNQQAPSVSRLDDNKFVVVWQLHDNNDNYNVHGVMYDTGLSVIPASNDSDEFVVTDINSNYTPSIVGLSADSFFVAWSYANSEFRGLRYTIDNSGVLQHDDKLILDTNEQNLSRALEEISTAKLPDGRFIVTWAIKSGHGNFDVFGQLYDSNASTIGENFRVNTTANDYQTNPAISVFPEGNFVVVWESHRQDDTNGVWGSYGQRYAANGSRIGTEFRLHTITAKNQQNPAVAALPNGNFVATWFNQNTTTDIRARLFRPFYDMKGSENSDILAVGYSDRMLTGAGGKDLFAFNLASAERSKHFVRNFDPELDKLLLIDPTAETSSDTVYYVRILQRDADNDNMDNDTVLWIDEDSKNLDLWTTFTINTAKLVIVLQDSTVSWEELQEIVQLQPDGLQLKLFTVQTSSDT